MLRARGVRRTFKGGGTGFTLLVEQIELTRGAQVAIVGPSGCGKSTLLGLLSLALRPDHADTLMLGGVDAADLWRRGRVDELTALRSECIGFVPQTAGLLPFLTLGENIALPQRFSADPTRIFCGRWRMNLASAPCSAADRRKCRWASDSVPRWRARWDIVRRYCWQTSRRPRCTPRRPMRSSR